jgi:hypothetical protein
VGGLSCRKKKVMKKRREEKKCRICRGKSFRNGKSQRKMAEWVVYLGGCGYSRARLLFLPLVLSPKHKIDIVQHQHQYYRQLSTSLTNPRPKFPAAGLSREEETLGQTPP